MNKHHVNYLPTNLPSINPIHPSIYQPINPSSPIRDGVFDVVAGSIDEYPALVPGPALDADVLVDRTQGFQLAVADGNG